VSPVKAFLGLLALAVAAGLVLMLMTPVTVTEHPSATTPTAKPDYSLTNAEAIARFKELDELRLDAYSRRNAELIEQAFTNESPIASRIRSEIRDLRVDGVLSKTSFETRSITVAMNAANLIRLHQIVVIRPRFVTESGRDVTKKHVTERQEIRWTLKRDQGDWLLHDAVVTKSQILSRPDK
jgi:hypothetical protein